jgi:hypothetical protein
MSKTIDLLFDYIRGNIEKLPSPVYFDYFGIDNICNENEDTILGVYTGLIREKGISKELLENCFKTNRLDELIHQKHKFHVTVRYHKFCVKKMTIGKTYTENGEDIQKLEILDDDHCPSCLKVGYITRENCNGAAGRIYDCGSCFKIMCKLCSHYNDDEGTYFCNTGICDIESIKKCIREKISRHRTFDKKKFQIAGDIADNDVLELFRRQNYKCYVCDDAVLTCGWNHDCFYQFSIDRLDNTQPHNRNNVLISCYYCNCRFGILKRGYPDTYKICSYGCHRVKRDIQLSNYDGHIFCREKINSLHLFSFKTPILHEIL